MDFELFDFSFYLAPHLSARSWLAMRATCRAWAEVFESLCRVHRVAMGLGRPLGLSFLDFDPRWMYPARGVRYARAHNNWVYSRRATPFRRAVIRAHVCAADYKTKIRLIDKECRHNVLGHHAIQQVCDDFEATIIAAARAGVYIPPRLCRIASAETVTELAKYCPGAVCTPALERGLPLWGVYRDRANIQCPRLLPREAHTEFMRKLIACTRTQNSWSAQHTCEYCKRAFLLAPIAIWKYSFLAWLAHDNANDETLRIFAQRVGRIDIFNYFVHSNTRNFELIRRLSSARPEIIDTPGNRRYLKDAAAQYPAARNLLALLEKH